MDLLNIHEPYENLSARPGHFQVQSSLQRILKPKMFVSVFS